MLDERLLFIAFAAHVAVAQSTVSGTVRDSLAHRPLVGAVVQLVPSNGDAQAGRSTTSDSLGRFAFVDVASGDYVIGFIHPFLDSLGIEPMQREIGVRGSRPIRIDLATPAAWRLRAAVCATSAGRDSGATVIGFVRDTHREALAGVPVTAEWLEVSIGRGGIGQNTGRRSAITRENGWFALCNVPSAGTIFMKAARGDSASDAIAVVVPDDRLVRRDLYIDNGTTAQVRGVVTNAEGAPIAGVRVTMIGGPETRANARGEWTLSQVPAGTRTIELQSIGYSPERVAVDALEGAPPVRVTLSTLQAVLDTVRITANRDALAGTGFEQRRRSTAGHFLTGEDVRRRAPVATSDAFRMIPGLRVEPTSTGAVLTARGMFAERCRPTVFVDGSLMWDLGADDIDAFVQPDEVAGIEIYDATDVPPQFSAGNFGFGPRGALKAPCAAIVIWTKPTPRPGRRLRSALAAAGVLGAGLLVRVLLLRDH